MKNINYTTGIFRASICLSALYSIIFLFAFYYTAEPNWNFHGSFTSETGLNACYETSIPSLFFPQILYSWMVGLLHIAAHVLPLTSAPNLLFITALYSSTVFVTLALFLHLITRTTLLAIEWVVDGFKNSQDSKTKTCS